jgi:hypothetical protein
VSIHSGSGCINYNSLNQLIYVANDDNIEIFDKDLNSKIRIE